MRRFKIKKYTLLFVAICVILASNFTPAQTAQIYQPYPIIFVHGIHPGNWGDFYSTRYNLEPYFYSIFLQDKYKYFHKNKEEFFPVCDYSLQSDGDIPTIARTTLQQTIIKAISSYPVEVPENERKVIIVAHSMGGLVVRSFLKQFPSYKELGIVDKVIFLGTPHLGAPSASAAWSLAKVNREILNLMATDYATFYSQCAGSHKRFSDESSNLSVDGLIYDELSSEIENYHKQILKDFYGISKNSTPDPDGIALEQLRLAGDVSYHKVFEKAYKNKKQNITIDLSIDGANTFLGESNLYLSNPTKYSVILGYYRGYPDLPAWWVNKLRKKYEPNFTFPVFSGRVQSVLNAIEDGDGVVTAQSQLGIGGYYSTIENVHHTAETKSWQTILQALDDPPVIESVRFQSGLMYYLDSDYIVFKIKDYLLADIEVESLTINGIDFLSTIPSEYKVGNFYKPYLQYGKDFLKERYVTETDQNPYGQTVTTKLHLMPGEFYIKAKTSDILSGNRKISIKVKNPAQKVTECELYLSQNHMAIKKSGSGSGSTYSNPSETWEQVKQRAYDNFSASQKIVYSPYYGYFGTIIEPIGLYSLTEAYSWLYTDKVYTSWNASLRMVYSHWLNFRLNTGNKPIKSIKFIGNLERSGTEDFNISLYRDIEGPWPPQVDSTGDEFLFSLNTLSNNGSIGIAIDKTKVNPTADNIWEIRPEFLEYNCIQDYIPPAVGETTYTSYSKGAIINGGGGYSYPNRVPALMVTFEENNP